MDRQAPQEKVFHDGTHRATDPATTLARVMPHAATCGVTRLGMITGLDRVGIPVATACRPNSRSLATFQGKGTTPDAARASALMEAIEVFHAETIETGTRIASWRSLREEVDCVDADRLPRCRGSRFDADLPIAWIAGERLGDGTAIRLPFECVSADFRHPQPPGSHCFAASTNGLASGNTRDEALAHALAETIERDAIALWRMDGAVCDPARALAEGSLAEPRAIEFAARCRRAGLRVALWNATSDVAVAVVVCLLQAADERVVDMGSGCHADRDVAVLRAITEAAQARLTRISGARDDLDDDAYPEDPGGVGAAARFFDASPRGSVESLPQIAGPSARHDLEAMRGALAARGLHEIVAVDLTKPALGIPVMRVVVPGLEGPAHAAGLGYVPGARARARTTR
jgi:YcaO-like protein with predicted kinase domain